jgi:ribosomal protein L6P/L9E
LKTRSKIEVHKDFCRIALGTHFAKTLRSIISNYLYRLHKPHFHILIAKGPNFKFSLESPGQILLDVGKSYKPAITIPHGVSVRLSTKRTLIFCTSCSTTVLSNFIASLKRQRPYNPYTGTGIFFKGLRLKLKVGKKK